MASLPKGRARLAQPPGSCPCRKSDPDVLVMQSTKNELCLYGPGGLNEPMDRCILTQR
jgi:hypothetical protein